MNDTDAYAILGMLKAAFPRFEMATETAAVYANQLRSMNREYAEIAVADVLRTAKVFPAISDLWRAYEPVASRAREERERQERLRAEDAIDRSVPVAEILKSVPREHLGWLEEHNETFNLPRIDGGPCDDCKDVSAVRYQFARLSLCRKCAGARSKAASKVVDAA